MADDLYSSGAQTKLIINYLPQNLDDEMFASMFSEIGQVESFKIMRDLKTGYSYGFGFITYVDPLDAQRAIHQLNGFQVGNKRIKVSYSRPPGERIKDTNLYITNLPSHITEDDLESLFGRFGKIVQKHLLINKQTGMSRGVAFVRFDSREEAQQAITQLDGQVAPGGTTPLSIKIAEEHGKQKAAYYQGVQAGMRQGQRVIPNSPQPFTNYGGYNNIRGPIHPIERNILQYKYNRGNTMRGRVHSVGWNTRQNNYSPYDY